MMAAYVTAPGYRPEALERFHQGLAPLYLNLTRTPGGVMQSQVSRFLHDGDPRFGYPDQDDAAKRTLEELKAWLAEPLAASYHGDLDRRRLRPGGGVEGREFDLREPAGARCSQTSLCRAAQSPLSERAEAQDVSPSMHATRRPMRRYTGPPPTSARSARCGGCSCWRRCWRAASSSAFAYSRGFPIPPRAAIPRALPSPAMACCMLWSMRLPTKLRCWRWRYETSPVGSCARASPRTNWSGRATRW